MSEERKATPEVRQASAEGPAGAVEQGMFAAGPLGTCEIPQSPPDEAQASRGAGVKKPLVSEQRSSGLLGANHRTMGWYRQAKEDEARRDGLPEVGAPAWYRGSRGTHPRGPGGGKAGAGETGPLKGTTADISRSTTVSTKLQRIAELASQTPKMVLTSLSHHIDIEFLKEAYRRTRKDGAAGVDGQSAADYERELDSNLSSLLDRFKSGRYFAPPVRRVHIPKGDGKKTRPIGIPTIEDKILQRAVTMVLEAVYEQDFLDCSYGFRPGRSAHQALQAIWKGLMDMGGGWVLDVDIKAFFDTLNHGHLRSFLDQRVRDGVLRRTIGKWLNAGVMENGSLTLPEAGTPQGGVISPLLANLYLHEVLDKWFAEVVRPRLHGSAFLVRYADDFVIVCAEERDARRVMDVLPQRFGRCGLTLHPEKTRLVRFTRPSGRPGDPPDGNDQPPETFDLLGFTHYWGCSRWGRWLLMQKTAKGRFSRALKKIAQWCRENRHLPIGKQHCTLNQKLRGHDAYYGIPNNGEALKRFRCALERIWRGWLNRRGGRRPMRWERFKQLIARFPLSPARIRVPACNHA